MPAKDPFHELRQIFRRGDEATCAGGKAKKTFIGEAEALHILHVACTEQVGKDVGKRLFARRFKRVNKGVRQSQGGNDFFPDDFVPRLSRQVFDEYARQHEIGVGVRPGGIGGKIGRQHVPIQDFVESPDMGWVIAPGIGGSGVLVQIIIQTGAVAEQLTDGNAAGHVGIRPDVLPNAVVEGK